MPTFFPSHLSSFIRVGVRTHLGVCIFQCNAACALSYLFIGLHEHFHEFFAFNLSNKTFWRSTHCRQHKALSLSLLCLSRFFSKCKWPQPFSHPLHIYSSQSLVLKPRCWHARHTRSRLYFSAFPNTCTSNSSSFFLSVQASHLYVAAVLAQSLQVRTDECPRLTLYKRCLSNFKCPHTCPPEHAYGSTSSGS